ncbi:MAG TPA: MarR family winged helix-turn-helix transcriptional regulator [Steroidobacteraceae bacterium]|jgi:DNA-binding MarR family transcriptional regulator|nr:MarR family winged helix-turn-helix transcriptional regulator [Steroidobacteraceae bacterium]
MDIAINKRNKQPDSPARQKLRDHIVARLCRLADAMLRASSRQIKKLWDISNTDLRLLSALENEDSLPMVEIVRRTLVDQAWVSRSLHDLESKDLVERRSDPKDSRAKRVSLTRKGRQILEESRPYAKWSEDFLLKNVDEKKLKAFLDQLEANTQGLLNALEPKAKKRKRGG